MKLSQKRTCESIGDYGDCRALERQGERYFCILDYSVSKDAKPVEKCLKPRTDRELVDAIKILKIG